MSGHDASLVAGSQSAPAPAPLRRRASLVPAQGYGTITVVGGGCYGSYYVRQLGRARQAGALDWEQLIVVDRDPRCRVAIESSPAAPDIVTSPWFEHFAEYLAGLVSAGGAATRDAIVPSPLMPHLLFDWLLARARARYPSRRVEVRPLSATPAVPWQRASASGETHYVSFAEWMCPINCIEPDRCPATRGVRAWTMPAAVERHVVAEREAGHNIEGPHVFHCTHRAYGVGMIDVQNVLDAERQIAAVADRGQAAFLVGTVSHCHGALGVLAVGP